MSIPYWGRKDETYNSQVLKLYPDRNIHTIIDCCMGSGGFSNGVSSGLNIEKKIAMEIDPGVCALHRVIKNKPFELIDGISTIKYSPELFWDCRNVITLYNAGKISMYDVDVAKAEMILLYFSHNAMRMRPRNLESYKKHTDKDMRYRCESALLTTADRIFLKAPTDIMRLNEKWQDIEILNTDFMDHTYYWNDERAWIYIDPPYELSKRGIKENTKVVNGKYGYDFDFSRQQHEMLISRVIDKSTDNSLKAAMMIATNYEVDNEGAIIVPGNDRYSKLLNYGFTMISMKKKGASYSYTSFDNNEPGVAEKKRRKKMEVLYINYKVC